MLLIGQFSDDDGVGCEYPADELPAKRTEDYLAEDGADGGKGDEIGVVEIGADPDDEDDFGYFDEQRMLVAFFGFERID